MRNIIYFKIGIVLLLIYSSANAQRASEKSILAVAEKSMQSKNYYDALSKYKELLEFDENNISYLYNAAEAARLHGAYGASKNYYELVLKHKDNNTYPIASFYLGQVQQFQGDYQGAKTSFLLYRTEHANEDEYLMAYAEKEMNACEWAINQIAEQGKEIKCKRLGDEINSSYSDFAATAFGSDLRFSSERFENTFNTIKPKRMTSNFLLSKNEAAAQLVVNPKIVFPGKGLANASFSRDQSKVIFTVCEDLNDHDKRCQLYLSMIDKNGIWGEATKLPDFINVADKTTTQPSLGINYLTNNEVLYFVSDRDGGKGKLDIWYCQIDSSGAYSEPLNASGINTIEDDVTPYFHSESSSLYFSSRGYLGFGGFDVFSSTKNKSSWTSPNNLGSQINSSYDDVYFTLGPSDKAFFSSNRTASKFIDDINEVCCLDIYEATMPKCDVKLKVLIFDALTLTDLNGATVKLTEIGNPDFVPIELKYDSTNEYHIPLDCNKEYRLDVSKPEYTSESLTFLSGRPIDFNEILKKIYLKPEPVRLEVLTFTKKDSLPLRGCEVALIDLDDPLKQPVILTNLNSNLFEFPLIDKCHRYKITANKEDYAFSSNTFVIDCNSRGKIQKKLYLEKFLVSLLPLYLYFDNDKPRPVNRITYTNLTYSQTYKTYLPKKDIFISKYCALNPVYIIESCSADMESFFVDSVQGGKERLEIFLERLASDLNKGRKYEIFIKGYASPLASNAYNILLGKRRIQCLRNEFSKYNKGVLNKYLKSGLLIITERSFGEESAPPGISYEEKDPGSIYQINASRERRIVIEEIK
ncbi:MAG: hypothetical protein ABI851_04900 [Saprospiraceae bacterium]